MSKTIRLQDNFSYRYATNESCASEFEAPKQIDDSFITILTEVCPSRQSPQRGNLLGDAPSPCSLSFLANLFPSKLPGILSSSCRMAQARNQDIYAPSDEVPRGVKPVFPTGTTSKVDMSN